MSDASARMRLESLETHPAIERLRREKDRAASLVFGDELVSTTLPPF